MSRVETCEGCRGLRGHMRLKDAMCKEFDKEYEAARLEQHRLLQLYKQACWYNFEVKCRDWRNPWHESLGGCGIRLGNWYRGSLLNAPALAIQTLEHELRLVADEVQRCDKQRSAPHDWAPGGREYERLCREGAGAALYGDLRATAQSSDQTSARR